VVALSKSIVLRYKEGVSKAKNGLGRAPFPRGRGGNEGKPSPKREWNSNLHVEQSRERQHNWD